MLVIACHCLADAASSSQLYILSLLKQMWLVIPAPPFTQTAPAFWVAGQYTFRYDGSLP